MLGVFPYLADFFFPRTCVVCGRPLLRKEDSICVCCLSDIPLTYYWLRPRNPMADRFNSRIEARSYADAAALFHYSDENDYRNITRALKYGSDISAGRYFSSMLGRRLAESPRFSDVDVVVPVPLHWTRRFRRGYNQAEVIARSVALELPSAAVRTDVLKRVRRTKTQTAVDVYGKTLNVKGAFRCAGPFRAAHVLIVDDVFTTGATVAECAAALRSVLGADVRISAAALGFVGD